MDPLEYYRLEFQLDGPLAYPDQVHRLAVLCSAVAHWRRRKAITPKNVFSTLVRLGPSMPDELALAMGHGPQEVPEVIAALLSLKNQDLITWE